MKNSGLFTLFILLLVSLMPFVQGCEGNVPEDVSLGGDLDRSPEQILAHTNINRDVDLRISGDNLRANDTLDLKFGMTSSSGFVTRDPLIPGEELILKVRVYNDEPVCAGGFVEFSLGDAASLGWVDWVADTVPFYIDANKDYVDVTTYYRIPYARFNHLAPDELEELILTVAVLPDETCNDTSPDNNLLHVYTHVKGIAPVVHDPVPDVTVESVYCRNSDGSLPAQLIPGAKKALYAQINYNSDARGQFSYNIHQNNSLIRFNKGSGESAKGPFNLMVPWEIPTDGTHMYYKVIAENGHQSSYEVPIEWHDPEMRNVGISWEAFSNSSAGNNVRISCKVFNNSEIPFAHVNHYSRYLFVVNGQVSEPKSVNTSFTGTPYMREVNHTYTIPENCRWPLEVYVLADPFNLMREKSEMNNVARAVIPEPPAPASGDRINLSVSAENLWHYPAEIRPGEKLYLFAAVYNDSTVPLSGFRVHFYVNNNEIDANNSLFRGTINPGQYHIFYKEWVVPEDLDGNPVFEVLITHPNDNLYNADDDVDNRAEMNLTLSKPDLLVDEARITGEAGGLLRGRQPANVTVGVWNRGDAWAKDAIVDIYLCGEKVGTKTVSVPPRGGLSFTIPVIVPLLTDQSPPVDEIAALPGIVWPTRGYYDAELVVRVDPGNLIDEADETNNELGPISAQVSRAQGQGVVFAYVYSYANNQSPVRAWVTIKAGGQTLSTFTDDNGHCSFHYVPQGTYELIATAERLNESTQSGEIYPGYSQDVIFHLHNHSFIKGRVTNQSGNPIEGVSIELRDYAYDWSVHNQGGGVTQSARVFTDTSGYYNIYVPAGDRVLDVTKLGYEPQTIETTVTQASNHSHNLTMVQTNLAYLQVLVVDGQGNPLEVTLEALDSNKRSLNPRVMRLTSSASVEYLGQAYREMIIPIPEPQVDNMFVRASGDGLEKTVPVPLSQGLVNYITITFGQSGAGSSDDHQSGIFKKIVPHRIESTQGGYTAQVLYGLFDISAFARVSNSVLTQISATIIPDYWYYSGVQGRWTPLGVEEIGMDIVCTDHSSQRTIARIKKVVIISNGLEVGQAYYPIYNLISPSEGLPYSEWGCVPDVGVNWDNLRIKFYMTVDGGTSSPVPYSGNIILEWDPKQNIFTRLGYYNVDQNTNIYTETWQ